MRNFNRLIHNLFFDLKYGRFLGGVKHSPYAMQGANDTANSDYQAMSLIFKGLIKSNDILVDIGCGKGLIINFWISNFPTNHIVGIELDPQIASKTAKRLANHKNVTIITGNAIELIPDNANLFYLFNPFNCHIMNDFKESLISKFYDHNLDNWIHSFRIVYYNPVCSQIFVNDNKFSCAEIEMPDGYHKCLLIEQLPV